MLNPFQQVNWSPGTRELRSFARSLVIGFPVVALLMVLAGWFTRGTWDWGFPCKLGSAGIAAGLVFWVLPMLARPFYLVWYAISCSIGLVISNVLLGLIYYTLLTSAGVLRRAMGRTPIQKNLNRATPTYWIDAEPPPDTKWYYNQS